MNLHEECRPAMPEENAEQVSMKRLPGMLRGFGAAVLVAALSLFLFQGWNSANDTTRYLLLLACTAALALIGIITGHYLRESKGARLLLSLMLAAVPVNFAILGSFVHSALLPGDSTAYLEMLNWHMHDPASALGISGMATLLLAPLSYLAFMVMSRRSAATFTALYMGSNIMLLLPSRDTQLIGWLVLAMSVVVMYCNNRARRRDPGLMARDGLTARILQFLPLLIMLGRSVWLYSADVFMSAIISILLFLLLRHAALLMEKDSRARRFMEKASLLPAAAFAASMTQIITRALPMAESFSIPLFVSIAAGLLIELSLRASDGGLYRRIAALVVTAGMLFNQWLIGGVLMAMICLLSGIAVAVYGYLNRQSLVMGSGVFMALVGLGFQLLQIARHFDLGNWGSLAVIGVLAIVGGSFIERHGEKMKARFLSLGSQFRSWQY